MHKEMRTGNCSNRSRRRTATDEYARLRVFQQLCDTCSCLLNFVLHVDLPVTLATRKSNVNVTCETGPLGAQEEILLPVPETEEDLAWNTDASRVKNPAEADSQCILVKRTTTQDWFPRNQPVASGD